MKKTSAEIKTYQLDSALYRLHKDESLQSDFGLDNSSELIEGGFGLYSSANVKSTIGPIKTHYYRAALVRAGVAKMNLGIETYPPPARPHRVWVSWPSVFALRPKRRLFGVLYAV